MPKAIIKAIEEKIENPETTALEMQLLEMYLTVEWYDIENDVYQTGTFYHTDLVYTPIIYNKEWMALVDTVSLHEY